MRFFFKGTPSDSGAFGAMESTSAPIPDITSTGWNPGTITALNFTAPMRALNLTPEEEFVDRTAFSGGPNHDEPLDGSRGDAFRTQSRFQGKFAPGIWTISVTLVKTIPRVPIKCWVSGELWRSSSVHGLLAERIGFPSAIWGFYSSNNSAPPAELNAPYKPAVVTGSQETLGQGSIGFGGPQYLFLRLWLVTAQVLPGDPLPSELPWAPLRSVYIKAGPDSYLETPNFVPGPV